VVVLLSSLSFIIIFSASSNFTSRPLSFDFRF
jgi:hypothetical protein